MIETYYIGAYWGVRKELAVDCAQRAEAFLKCLAQCDLAFTHWFRGGQSREEALSHPFTPTEENLHMLFLEGKNYTDFGHNFMEDLGFSIGLWSGDEEGQDVGLTIHCGSYASNPHVNSCVITLPYEGATAERLLCVPTLVTLMKCVISAWEPDWGVVNSRLYRDIAPQQYSKSHLVGWITYLSARHGFMPSVTIPCYLMPIAQLGSLMITTNDRFTANNPEHVAAANHILEILEQAHMLGPME